MLMHSGDKPIKCTQSDYKKAQTDKKFLKCSHCELSFFRKSDLNKHVTSDGSGTLIFGQMHHTYEKNIYSSICILVS